MIRKIVEDTKTREVQAAFPVVHPNWYVSLFRRFSFSTY